MDDGRTTEPAYTISSPRAFGSGELNRRDDKKLQLPNVKIVSSKLYHNKISKTRG